MQSTHTIQCAKLLVQQTSAIANAAAVGASRGATSASSARRARWCWSAWCRRSTRTRSDVLPVPTISRPRCAAPRRGCVTAAAAPARAENAGVVARHARQLRRGPTCTPAGILKCTQAPVRAVTARVRCLCCHALASRRRTRWRSMRRWRGCWANLGSYGCRARHECCALHALSIAARNDTPEARAPRVRRKA